MIRVCVLRVTRSLPCLLLLSTSALAWDPNEGVEPPPARYMPTQPMPRLYAAPPPAAIPAPAPVYTAPAYTPPPPVYTPPPVAEPVAAAPAPVYTPPPEPAPAYTPPPESYSYAPEPAPEVAPESPTPYTYGDAAHDEHRFSLGAEGFYDHYEEPDRFPDLNENAYYGAVDLGYDYYLMPDSYLGIEQRVSYGKDRYKSSQGTIDDIPQWEFDTRLLGGYDGDMGENRRMKLYLGLGSRYYLDKSKGTRTTGGALGYERRIFQLYVPVGVTYSFPTYGLTFSPNLELDPLVYGNVQTRLQNIPGREVFNNRQKSGLGMRAEFMIGQSYGTSFGWQFGPYVRYWDIPDSEPDFDSQNRGGMEPRNTRFQGGAKLKLQF